MKRMAALLLFFSFVLIMTQATVFSEGEIKGTLKVSDSTVHSGAKFTISVELSSASGKDINAEISDGSKTYSLTVPSGQTVGSVEITAPKSSETAVKTYTLSGNDSFTAETKSVKVKILPKPVMTFNANFLMASVGKQVKVYFKCKKASQMTVPLPVSLRLANGKVLQKFTVDKTHGSFEYLMKIGSDWEFPFSLEIHNDLTDTACKTIPVMVTDLNKPGIRRVDTTEKKIALGFDCGYNNKFTDYIMDVMDEYNCKVTFFVTGFFCQKFPDQLKKIHERGHEIGNHTMQHLRMAELKPEAIYQEIQGVNDLVREATGVSPVIMRPPYGSANSNVVAVSRMAGCETVFWTMDSYDWDPKQSAETIIERSTKNMGEGCILLFHNSAPKTKQTLKKILDDYKAKGLQIVPVSDLLYDGHYLVDENGTQKPDPNNVKVSGSELMSGRTFTVNVSGGTDATLELVPVFSDAPAYRCKKDVSAIQADPSVMKVSYDFAEPLQAPVSKGDKIGTASFSYQEKVWFTAEMVAASDVPLSSKEGNASVELSPSDARVSPSDSQTGSPDAEVILGLNVAILGLAFCVAAVVHSVRKKRTK